MVEDFDKADILAYLDKLNEEITLLRKDIKEIKIVFDKLPEMAEKDREVLTTFLSQIKNSVDDLKISLSNLELVIDVSFKKLKTTLENELKATLLNSLNLYFEKELPKVLYVIEKVVSKNQAELLKKTFEQEINHIYKALDDLKKENDLINKKINALTIINAKTPEEKLKIFLLTTDKKEIKKKDLEHLFGKDVVKKVLKELEGKLEIKIV